MGACLLEAPSRETLEWLLQRASIADEVEEQGPRFDVPMIDRAAEAAALAGSPDLETAIRCPTISASSEPVAAENQETATQSGPAVPESRSIAPSAGV